jgi:hypothetical protein
LSAEDPPPRYCRRADGGMRSPDRHAYASAASGFSSDSVRSRWSGVDGGDLPAGIRTHRKCRAHTAIGGTCGTRSGYGERAPRTPGVRPYRARTRCARAGPSLGPQVRGAGNCAPDQNATLQAATGPKGQSSSQPDHRAGGGLLAQFPAPLSRRLQRPPQGRGCPRRTCSEHGDGGTSHALKAVGERPAITQPPDRHRPSRHRPKGARRGAAGPPAGGWLLAPFPALLTGARVRPGRGRRS